MTEKINELKKYMSGTSGKLGMIVIMAFLSLIGIGGFFTIDPDEGIIFYFSIVASLFFGGLLILFVVSFFRDKNELDSLFTELINTGRIYEVLNDFQQAGKPTRDVARFGNNYIFLRGQPHLVRYFDIVQIYEFVHKTNGIVDKRAANIRYNVPNGKILEYSIEVHAPGKNIEEPRKIMMFILSKNPNIKVGYK